MMRKIPVTAMLFFACSFYLMAQHVPANYDMRWKKIDSLISKKGLTQSAYQEVTAIYESAKKDKNDAQLIKALLYRANLQEMKAEDATKLNIASFEYEISSSAQPARSILQSILAETYWNYFQQTRWELYGRNTTINFKKNDPATWGIEDFHRKISELFLASLSNDKLLQETKLDGLSPILIKGNVRYLRPTLFDLLAHRALDYFKSDEPDVIKPAFSFEIDNAEVFSDRSMFANYHFKSEDSSSLHYKGLHLFQQLLLFHQHDANPDALVDVDIERIQFAYQFGIFQNKEELYIKALENILASYPSLPVAAQAAYLEALAYSIAANQYDFLQDTSNRYGYLKAKAICEHVLQQKDSSEGRTNCENLLKDILRRQLSIQTEKINLPGEPFRALVSYRNVSKVYFRIIRVDPSAREQLGNNHWVDDFWKGICAKRPDRSFSQIFPETNDLQMHKAEIKVDSLSFGEYALLASSDQDFNLQKNIMSVQYFYVSGISYINTGLDYFVLNRKTGQPMPRTDVQLWYRYFNSAQKRYLERKGENIITDKEGYFAVNPPKTNNNSTFSIELTSLNDHLFLDDDIQQYDFKPDAKEIASISKTEYEKENLKTFFFTDRSIYRPGQTIYFKGMVLSRDFNTRQSKILPAFKTKVILYNVNDEKMDSVEVTTNEFGSYHGKFILPENVLNGSFTIKDDSTDDQQSFSVEEYKRPRFFIDFSKLKGSYHINDSVRISGSAKSYAGNSIDRASVKYRVIRRVIFPYPWLNRHRQTLENASQEIAEGKFKTGNDGSFSIDFKALPDLSVKKETEPVFTYTILADITDINGETRSGQINVRIGYQSLSLSIDLPSGDNVAADSLKNILIKTENLSGEFEPVMVRVAIFKLNAPERLIRERYWQQPDQFVMGKEEFLKYFPHDVYSNETQKETWEKKDRVFEKTDSSRQTAQFTIDHSTFAVGWYLIEASATDDHGVEVKNFKYVQLFDSRTGRPPTPQYIWGGVNFGIGEPGKQFTIAVGSSADEVFVIARKVMGDQEQAIEDTTLHFNFIALNNEKRPILFPIKESDRGGFAVKYAFVKNNRFYSGISSISVPWTNKELSISYATYRDKTLPGVEEKWKVKIGGIRKERVAAEVLTAMYDASLDQFKLQSWEKPDIYLNYPFANTWTAQSNFSSILSEGKDWTDNTGKYFAKNYDQLLSFGLSRHMKMGRLMIPKPEAAYGSKNAGIEDDDSEIAIASKRNYPGQLNKNVADIPKISAVMITSPHVVNDSAVNKEQKPGQNNQYPVQVRKNFLETAFFFPDLKTDTSGNIEFSFTMPEAVTQWKWMTFAHTKDLAFGYAEKNIITQKQLMVQPNFPRFLREGDKMELGAKIVNLADSEVTGQAELQLFDASTNQPVDGLFINREANQYFTAEAKQSVPVNFSIDVPYQFNRPVTYRVVVRCKGISDGEEATIPVLSNRILVTETLPINMRTGGTKTFRFEKLLQSGASETLNHHSLTIEFTANPAWYAVQALPYLIEYPYECAEQTFNRFFANALAAKIVAGSPRVKQVLDQWKSTDTSALHSNLDKDQRLKSILLEETPWVLEAKNETAQKKNIAMLFDLEKMNNAIGNALSKLQDMQLEDGGFAWFKGGNADRYITQYIASGIGHLKKLDALPATDNGKTDIMIGAFIPFLDKKIKEDYDALIKYKPNLSADHLSQIAIQYLYMRSFYPNIAIPGGAFPAVNYYRKQAQQYWIQQDKYMQAMIALALFRTGDFKTAKDILASLKQNALINEEKGMFWKEVNPGYYWYQSALEAQSLLIEAFSEINHDDRSVDAMKTWLLKQKQTENWNTTKATAEACYALLLQGRNWLEEEKNVQIHIGSNVISSSGNNAEGGTGYFKKIIDGNFVKPEMGNITVNVFQPKPQSANQTTHSSWGAVYWQYFEDLDKITGAATPLQITKKLFIEKNTDRGPVLEPVIENATLRIGDKIRIRIELRVDRDMEYVHMKDMRAACMEPVNVLSEYRWQGGLGYYESTKDASTSFFFDRLPKGTYVFEYPMFVTSAGNFSNGITTIQCMYAPEFSSHSEGIRINAE